MLEEPTCRARSCKTRTSSGGQLYRKCACLARLGELAGTTDVGSDLRPQKVEALAQSLEHAPQTLFRGYGRSDGAQSTQQPDFLSGPDVHTERDLLYPVIFGGTARAGCPADEIATLPERFKTLRTLLVPGLLSAEFLAGRRQPI